MYQTLKWHMRSAGLRDALTKMAAGCSRCSGVDRETPFCFEITGRNARGYPQLRSLLWGIAGNVEKCVRF